jgi:hypothetical protein
VKNAAADKAGFIPTLAVALLSAGLIAAMLRIAWNPSIDSYVQYVPVAAVFAAFVWDRAVSGWPSTWRPLLCDTLAVALALMRVLVPPLPFVSGHALFTGYAAIAAEHFPLRLIALVVLAQVAYVKLVRWSDWLTLLGGLAAAAAIGAMRWSSRDQPS